MRVQTSLVSTTETGRADYSLGIDASNTPLARATRHQLRTFATARVELDTLTYPDIYWNLITGVNYAGDWTYEICSDIDAFLYGYCLSGDTNATSVGGIAIFNSYDVPTDTPSDLYKIIALKFAPKVVELNFTNGIPLRQYGGKYLTVAMAHYSVNPTTIIDIQLSGMLDKLAGPRPPTWK